MKFLPAFLFLIVVPTDGTLLRQLKKTQGGTGGSSGGSNNSCGFTNKDDWSGQAPPGLIEPGPCVPFDDPLVQAYVHNPLHFDYKNYDPRCDTNNCPCGCCRYHPSMMRCDYSNLFAQQPVRYAWHAVIQNLLPLPCLTCAFFVDRQC